MKKSANGLAQGFEHAEAFCLMKYASRDGQVQETLWNSRDGVSPFTIVSKDGTKELFHVDWNEDICIPNYQPLKGSRIFADMTEQDWQDHYEHMVEQYWEAGMKDRFSSREAALEELRTSGSQASGSPKIVVVG